MKLFAVSAVRINASVCAEADVHAFGEGTLKCAMHRINRGMSFSCDSGRDVNVLIEALLQALRGHQRWDEIRAALLHHVESFVIEEAAVLDGVDSGANGTLGGFGAVSVRGRFAAQSMSLVDDRVQFLLRELWRVDVVRRRKHAARSTNLDHVGAIFVIEAHCVTSLIGAVDY